MSDNGRQKAKAGITACLPKKNGKTTKSLLAIAKRIFRHCPRTERGNALLFAEMFGEEVRFDHGTGLWIEKTSGIWSPDGKGAVFERMAEAIKWRESWAKAVSKDEDQLNQELSWARECDKHRIAENSLKWAQSLPALSTSSVEWDRDPYLIGTPDGVYDLRTGELAKNSKDREWYISHMTGCSPAPKGSDCPFWRDSLAKAMGGDTALQDYLQRLAGYLLTGSTKEQSLFWFLGEGGNGKTTFLQTIMAVMGSYAHALRVEALVASRHSLHPTEICDLKGKRLAVTSETEPNRLWREALLKQLSGGDKITAHKMHKDSISFVPSHKLIIVGNHAPQLSAVSEAERRRYQLIEWRVRFRFPDDPAFSAGDIMRDLDFNVKLEAEYQAILRWAMEGTQKWLRTGLDPPESVLLDSAAFMEGQDVLGQWIRENTEQGPELWQESTALFEDWCEWCRIRRERPGTQRSFTERLKSKRFTPGTTGKHHTCVIFGLRVQRVQTNSENGSVRAPQATEEKVVN